MRKQKKDIFTGNQGRRILASLNAINGGYIMDIETFKIILKEKTMPFTRSEICEMVESELSKELNQMDTDFIDCCLDALGV